MNITLRITSNFGNRAVYPVCDVSHKLADLIGTKTFTDSALKKLADLGYVITVQHQVL